MVKFNIFNDQFQQILTCLHCNGLIRQSIISFTHEKIYSIQSEEHNRAMRIFEYEHPSSVDNGSVESIEVDITLVMNLTKRIADDTILTIETDGRILYIDDGNDEIKIAYNIPENALEKIPFTIKGGVPIYGEKKKILDTSFTMLKSDLMNAVMDNSVLKTDFFRFKLHDSKLTLQVGDFDMFGNTKTFCFSSYNSKGDAKVTVDYGIRKIAETFGDYICIKTCNDATMLFTDVTDEYLLRVIIPPYVEKE